MSDKIYYVNLSTCQRLRTSVIGALLLRWKRSDFRWSFLMLNRDHHRTRRETSTDGSPNSKIEEALVLSVGGLVLTQPRLDLTNERPEGFDHITGLGLAFRTK